MLADNMTSRRDELSAPALFGMHSVGAWLIAGLLLFSLYWSVLSDLSDVDNVWFLGIAMMTVTGGVVGLLMTSTDPMPLSSTCLVAGSGPVGCLFNVASLSGRPSNLSLLNVFGVGVIICTFLCARGRTGTAWVAFLAMVTVLTGWSLAAGYGFYGLAHSVPSVAPMVMSTLFAIVIRPAAATLRELHNVSLDQAAKRAATEARSRERAQRRAEVVQEAGQLLQRIASGTEISAVEHQEAGVMEAQLRDSVRARSLAVPPLSDAVRSARQRGIDVLLLDDTGGVEVDPHLLVAFRERAVTHLERLRDGSVTVRLHPPGRPSLASVVSLSTDGTAGRLDMDAAGTIHEM